MPEISPARKIHKQALDAQERGDFIRSLELSDQAMAAYQKAKDKKGFAEIQALRFLTFRHLADSTGDRNYLIMAKFAALVSVELAKESKDKKALAIPLFNLAKAQETLGDIKLAVESFKEAVKNITQNPPQSHNRPAVVEDFKVHLSTAEYRAGDKSALDRAEGALRRLKTAKGATDYERHVWVSGGYMRMAEAVKKDDPKKAAEYMEKAKEVIDSDSDLTIRLNQWKELAKKLRLTTLLIAPVLIQEAPKLVRS